MMSSSGGPQDGMCRTQSRVLSSHRYLAVSNGSYVHGIKTPQYSSSIDDIGGNVQPVELAAPNPPINLRYRGERLLEFSGQGIQERHEIGAIEESQIANRA